MTADQTAVDLIASEFDADPAFFGEIAFQRDYWDVQRDIADAVARENSRTTVRSCHGTGKSQLAADLAIWRVVTGGVSIVTAPTLRQVRKVVWSKVRTSLAQASMNLGPDPLRNEWQIGPEIFAIGVAAESPVAMQGFHGTILIIVDEAMGIAADMFRAIEGMRAGGDVRLLLLGNPTAIGGPFYESHEGRRSSYTGFAINAFDTPNLVGLKEHPNEPWQSIAERMMEMREDDPRLYVAPRPYLVTRRWVWEKIDEWGFEHPDWESRVLGEFPSQSEHALIAMPWAESAKRIMDVPADAPWEAGIDVGGDEESSDGAETVCFLRHGPMVMAPPFATRVGEQAQREVREWLEARELEFLGKRKTNRSRIFVKYDSIGVGAYFSKPLREAGFNCRGVNVSRPAKNKLKFKSMKGELSWALRERFREGLIGGLSDPATIGQCVAVRWFPDAQGRHVIESKEQMLKRGMKSPDRYEALMICFAERRYIGGGVPVMISVS